jgi:16S rRNA (guanine527-N7)-methyltransferase
MPRQREDVGRGFPRPPDSTTLTVVAGKPLRDRVNRRLLKAGLSVDADLAVRLERYLQLLARWNAKINLTAFSLVEPNDEAIDRLLVEPVVAARHVGATAGSLIDIGSGSGSPGIPLRLALGPLKLLLVEAKTRKAVFLLEALRHLEIQDGAVETARFEQLLTRPELHEAFDVLSIRAVRAEARTLLTLQAFLRPGGRLLWFRGPGGPDLPENAIFPLAWTATYPLVESLRSRVVILTKQRQSGRIAPRAESIG